MRKEVIMLIGIFIMIMLPLSSAELLFSQPKSIYNLGDNFEISVTAKPSFNTNDFFIAKLSCASANSSDIEIYRSPLEVQYNNQKTVNVSIILNKKIINDAQGKCLIKANYSGEEASSQDFEIANLINVNLEVGRFAFNPGEIVKVNGTAVKRNGNNAQGFVEIAISSLNFSLSRAVSNGRFEFDVTLPEAASPGDYEMLAKVYEKDQDALTNEGNASISIRVRQIAKKIDIAFNQQNISPGSDFVYTAVIYDQAENQVAGEDVGIIIYDPLNQVFLKKLAKSGEANTIKFSNNETPGYWKVEANSQAFTKSKLFNLDELSSASFTTTNNTLRVTNTGNVRYIKQLEIHIGEETELVKVDLGLGEFKEFKLFAPNGNYEVKVNDGQAVNTLGSIELTGKAISVGNIGENILSQNGYVFVWIIVIIALLLTVFYLHKKVAKKSFFAKTPVFNSVRSTGPISSGERQEAPVIALRVENLDIIEQTGGTALQAINSAIMTAKESGASIYSDGKFKMAIFAPLITGIKDNEQEAVKIAQEIYNLLEDYNKKSAEKINFGVGVNLGEMIIEKSNNKTRYTSIGNTIAATKKIASYSREGVLLSERIHRKVANTIKSVKLSTANLWKVDRIINRDQHSKFISGFLGRQKKS